MSVVSGKAQKAAVLVSSLQKLNVKQIKMKNSLIVELFCDIREETKEGKMVQYIKCHTIVY